MDKKCIGCNTFTAVWYSEDDAAGYTRMRIMICVDAFTACNPFNPGPLPPQPGTVGTPVASSWHLHHTSLSWGHARNENLGFVDYFDCHFGVVDDGGLGTLPQLRLVQMVPLLSPCMNISHRTAICLWLYLIAEMMMLTMVMVFNARRGIEGLCCYQYSNQMLCGVTAHIFIKHNPYLLRCHHLRWSQSGAILSYL